MTWDEYCIILLRQIIDDDIEPYKYADDRLLKLLLSSAIFVQTEVSLKNSYEVNLTTKTLTPDPLTFSPPDMFFITLIVYKSACILAQSKPMNIEYDSIRVQDDLTVVDIKGKNSSSGAAATNFCDMYDRIKQDGAWNGADGVNRYGLVINSYGQSTARSNFR